MIVEYICDGLFSHKAMLPMPNGFCVINNKYSSAFSHMDLITYYSNDIKMFPGGLHTTQTVQIGMNND